ncbi:MAG: bifunctional uroporphyrinogen-III C-methylase/synthase [Acidobacteria bacterium]|nr:bifunctional uroporphyrinogen-III C-methylase/synthase [Acidobacteriota bacterium]
MTTSGHVSLIGAGPGDPGLISVQGLRLLSLADVVIYDRAVSNLLRWARPDAETIEAGAPAEGTMAQDALSMLIADKAREGLTVARLKWGDPFVFDSGGKEALFLHEQRIPFDVVPGIPAAVGASAYAGIPLTYPGSGDAVVLLRGSEGGSDALPDVDWGALARLDGTIVCDVTGRLGAAILTALVTHGRDSGSPAALVYSGTMTSQRTVGRTIADLLAHMADGQDTGAATLIVGEVASLRQHLRWFDERPLFGKRIIITRSRDQAHELADQLEELGAQTIEAPIFRMAPADDPEAMDRAAASIDAYQWVIFTSTNAVTRFFSALLSGPRDMRAMGNVSVCAIGPTTAERIEARGVKPDVVMREARLEELVEALGAAGSLESQRVLIVRPDFQRDTLAVELARHGATVTDLVAYTTVSATPESADAQKIYKQLLEGRVDAVTFMSPTAVRRFASLIGSEQAADLLRTTVVAALGPVTAEAAEQLGITAQIVPQKFTIEALVASLVAHFHARPSR